MVYKMKIYTKNKKRPVAEIRCGDQYLDEFKKDLFDNNLLFLDCENVIVPKSQIKEINIKKISEN